MIAQPVTADSFIAAQASHEALLSNNSATQAKAGTMKTMKRMKKIKSFQWFIDAVGNGVANSDVTAQNRLASPRAASLATPWASKAVV